VTTKAQSYKQGNEACIGVKRTVVLNKNLLPGIL
jgi:hypothetical protein